MSKLLRRLTLVVGAIAVIIGVVAIGVYVLSERAIRASVTVADESVVIPTDSASIARGRHLARAVTKCVDCHGHDLGGATIVDAPPMGKFSGMNLTRGKGGLGASLSDAEMVRAIRHGVAADGHKLVIMPSVEYSSLSAEDLGAVIAYVRSLAPVDREIARPTFGPVARVLIATSAAPLFAADVVGRAVPLAAAPPAGVTAAYGAYLAKIGGCVGCHGPTLSGGKIPQGDPSWLPAANLTPTGLAGYTEETFITALRTGVRPNGGAINFPMPWKAAAEMTDDEMKAVWAYLKTVPPKAYGGR